MCNDRKMTTRWQHLPVNPDGRQADSREGIPTTCVFAGVGVELRGGGVERGQFCFSDRKDIN